MRINTRGLIIRDTAVKNEDRLVTVLTPDLGVIRAFVRRARRLKGNSAAATQLLGYSELTLFCNRDTYTIDEADPIDIFFELRSDIERLSLAQYFCEMCCVFGAEGVGAEEELRLILNCLHLLARFDRLSPTAIKAIFELRMAAISGFMPELSGCADCGDDNGEMRFSLVDGTLFCSKCDSGNHVPVQRGVLAAMRHICSSPLERLFSFSLPDEGIKQLSQITENYILAQSGCDFAALSFYKSLFAHEEK